MKEIMLYLVTILIWGSTWIAIKFQLGPVDPMVSVIYRFGLAAVLLLAFCRFRGLSLKFSLRDHCFMALMGIFLFSVNYWLVYLAEQYLTSGLVAVLFSSLVFFNMANSALFMGAPVARKTLIGALAGIIGITLIFLPEIRAFDADDKGLTGVAIGMLSVFLASLGNIASARNTRHKIPVVQANAFGMTYGTLVLVVVALCMGKTFSFSLSPAYTGSLVFLSVFGSIVAFGTYLTLVGSMGADKAAYAIMVVPVVALVISSFAEGYVWTIPAVAGLSLVLAGNFL
ncbi:MAG: EamA family transporter, partial [Desulfobacterales bacterium]|nr:EamA family transporter [Desulfobacterales bacterium]